MTQNANTFLQVRDLVVEYTSDGKVIHAVNGVNFDLERGKALALVGETGAGKTTIAKSIMRILPDPPAHVRSGQVVLQGRDLMKLNEADMRKVRGKEISMIFQDPMTALNPTMRIGDQIAEVIRLHDKVTKAESMQKAQKMLETVGITAERYGNYPHQFSGGMKQRVVIAIALVFWDTHREWVLGGFSFLFLLIGSLLIWLLIRRKSQPNQLFSASIAELKKDQITVAEHD